MPFDKITAPQLFAMRVATGLTFLGVGAWMLLVAGTCALQADGCATTLPEEAGAMFTFATLLFGAGLLNAGMMLLELITSPPRKLSINVPFVAANFQVALIPGIVALGFAVRHATTIGNASDEAVTLQWLTFVGFVLNFTFALMTKLHWNFTENTGKALPPA